MSSKEITIVASEEEVISKLSELIDILAKKAIERDDVFKVGLSGYKMSICIN